MAHFDGEGNEIGIEHIDPLAVIQSIDGIARAAIAKGGDSLRALAIGEKT